MQRNGLSEQEKERRSKDRQDFEICEFYIFDLLNIFDISIQGVLFWNLQKFDQLVLCALRKEAA